MQGTRSCTRPRMAQGGTRMAMRMATRMDAGMDAGMDALTVRSGNRACPGRAHEQDRIDQRARETGVRNDKCPRKRHCPQDRLARQGRTTRERTTRQENRPEGPASTSDPGAVRLHLRGSRPCRPISFAWHLLPGRGRQGDGKGPVQGQSARLCALRATKRTKRPCGRACLPACAANRRARNRQVTRNTAETR